MWRACGSTRRSETCVINYFEDNHYHNIVPKGRSSDRFRPGLYILLHITTYLYNHERGLKEGFCWDFMLSALTSHATLCSFTKETQFYDGEGDEVLVPVHQQ